MGKLLGESVEVLPVCRVPVSTCCTRRRATSFTHVGEGNKPVHSFPGFVYVCVCVCVFIKLHITAQSGPVILVILCHSR